MDMTYSESQTPLFSPSYLNLVFEKHPWKIGESPHNTDCDATVGIINMYDSKNLHMPAHVQWQAELRSRSMAVDQCLDVQMNTKVFSSFIRASEETMG